MLISQDDGLRCETGTLWHLNIKIVSSFVTWTQKSHLTTRNAVTALMCTLWLVFVNEFFEHHCTVGSKLHGSAIFPLYYHNPITVSLFTTTVYELSWMQKNSLIRSAVSTRSKSATSRDAYTHHALQIVTRQKASHISTVCLFIKQETEKLCNTRHERKNDDGI